MPIMIIDNHERLLEQAEAMLELQRRSIEKACKEWVASHRAGPMYWLREMTATENYHWREQGIQPVMPFPYRPYRDRKIDLETLSQEFPHDFTADDPPDYLDIVMGYLLSSKILFVPKTREMMTSWLVVGFMTWYCQFYPKIEWASQSEDDLKAQGLIKYANILYFQQRPWLKQKYRLLRGSEEGTLHKIEWANGSSLIAMASGERKLASRHPMGTF